MWITIDQILCLKALKDTGSINGAAEVLNKAKSAVSYTIRKLDEQLGFPTLDRSQYRVQLTPQGEAFLEKSKKLIHEMDLLKEEIHKIASGVEMKLSMSATAVYPSDKINRVLREVVDKFPSTAFTFHREILSGERMLMEERVDIAIFEDLRNTLDLEGKLIGTVDLKLVVCANHPFLKLPKKEQTLQRLSQYPHIIQRSTIPDDNSMGSPDEALKWHVSDIDSKKELILNNLGWGRLPGHYIANELKAKSLIHLKNLAYDHSLEIYICKKKSKSFGPALTHIWNSFD